MGQQQAPKDEEMGADGMGVAGGSAPPPAEEGRGKEKVQHEEKEEEATQSEKKDATSCDWEPSSSASDSSRSVTSSVHSAKTSGTTMDVLRAAARKGMEGLGHQHEEMVQRVIDMQMLADEDPSKRPRAPFFEAYHFVLDELQAGVATQARTPGEPAQPLALAAVVAAVFGGLRQRRGAGTNGLDPTTLRRCLGGGPSGRGNVCAAKRALACLHCQKRSPQGRNGDVPRGVQNNC